MMDQFQGLQIKFNDSKNEPMGPFYASIINKYMKQDYIIKPPVFHNDVFYNSMVI